MSHSRIFQVSEEPIEKIDYITKSRYWEHWFLNEHADYVAESNREDDIKWLKEVAYKGIEFGEDEYGEFLVVTSKTDYFAKKFTRFTTDLEDISKMALTDFASARASIWKLEDAFEDKYGFYIDDTSQFGEFSTFDRFIRICNENTKYYIGGTMDYHY